MFLSIMMSLMLLSTWLRVARVFDAGTIEWSWGLDSNSPHPGLVNEAAQKITANILKDFLQNGRTSQSELNASYLEGIILLIVIALLAYVVYRSWVLPKLSAKRKQAARVG